jgi:hypothetical protein
MSEKQPIAFVDDPDKFSDLTKHRSSGGSALYTFSDGSLRYRFKDKGFWQPDAEFYFFRTITNMAAIPILKGAERQSSLDGLRSLYLKVFAELLAADGVPHVSYNAVEKVLNDGPGWPHWDAFLWPTIHCIRVGPMKQSLQDYIDELHRPRGDRLMDRHDGPQFYYRDYRNKLNPTTLDKMIGAGAPFLLLDLSRTWTVSGRALRDAIDFLAPLEYSETESHNSGGSYDA